jgi:hypothetical protein
MKKYFLSGFLLLTLNHLSLAETTLPDIKEGLWELTFKSDIAAIPTPMPSVSYSSEQCLSKQSAGDPQTLLQNKTCEILNLNQQASQITWEMRCNQQGIQMTGDGKVNYSYESFNGIFNMNRQGGGAAGMKIITQTSGRYLGACQ